LPPAGGLLTHTRVIKQTGQTSASRLQSTAAAAAAPPVAVDAPLIASVPDTAIVAQLLGWGATSSLAGQIGNEPEWRRLRSVGRPAGLTGRGNILKFVCNWMSPRFIQKGAFLCQLSRPDDLMFVCSEVGQSPLIQTILGSPPEGHGDGRRKDTYLESLALCMFRRGPRSPNRTASGPASSPRVGAGARFFPVADEARTPEGGHTFRQPTSANRRDKTSRQEHPSTVCAQVTRSPLASAEAEKRSGTSFRHAKVTLQVSFR